MPRTKLREAREAADLTQEELATRIGAEKKAVSAWEAGTQRPQPGHRRAIRDALHNNGPDLFKNFESDLSNEPDGEESNEEQGSQPCHIEMTRDTVDFSDSSSFVIPRADKELSLMDKLRRLIINAIGVTIVGNVQVITGPVVEPEEYLSQCTVAIDDCWSWLGQGSFAKVERALGTHMPTLRRFTSTLSPFQGIAASLAVGAKLMQAYLSSHQLDHTAREIHCTEAVHFAALSGNQRMYTIALEWQGYTYTIGDSIQPQRAIAIFEQALSGVESNAPLSKANISIGLALAHAQEKHETSDTQVRKHVELARMTLPAHPELDPFYRHCGLGPSELDQQEGQTYLYLAERSHNRDYAQKAYDLFGQSTSKQAMNQSKLGQSLIRKANAARVLGDMDECVACLTNGLVIAVQIDSRRRFNEVQDVIGSIPSHWQKETAIKELQQELTHALMLAHR